MGPHPKRKKKRKEITELDRARGRRIAEARLKKDLTQERLAELLGKSIGLVGQLETGSTGLTSGNAATLERVLEVPMAWLLTGDEPLEKRLAQTVTEQEQLDIIRSLPVAEHDAFMAIVRAAAKGLQRK